MADSEFQAEPPEEKRDKVRPARPRPRPRPEDEYEDEEGPERFRRKDAVETLIPYKNPTSLMAYYTGVFGLIPCLGLLLGPVAFILGIIGIVYSGKYPTAGGKGHSIAGIVLGIVDLLMQVVYVVLFLVLTKP